MDTMVIDSANPDNYELVEYYNVRAVPMLVIIDENGNVLKQHFGYTPYDHLESSIEDAYYSG
jgi:thioredoxin-related protein